MVTHKHHFGDIRNSDGKVFVSYSNRKRKDGTPFVYEMWITPEAFEKRRQRGRDYNNRPDIKDKRQSRLKEKCKNPEYVAARQKSKKEWLDRPEIKIRVNQWRKEYLSKPEVQDRIKKRMFKYNREPCVKERLNKKRKHRRDTDPQYSLKEKVRSRIRIALKNACVIKSEKTTELIGCSYSFLKEYLESQFRCGMAWDKPYSFHIDHILPISSFNLNDPEQLKAACHWSNLQPLYPEENLRKGAKILTTK
jgi:hypothetical protein